MILLTISLIAILILSGCAQKDAGEAMEDKAMEEKSKIKIGVMAPLTGGAASYGLSVQKGIQLAAEQWAGMP